MPGEVARLIRTLRHALPISARRPLRRGLRLGVTLVLAVALLMAGFAPGMSPTDAAPPAGAGAMLHYHQHPCAPAMADVRPAASHHATVPHAFQGCISELGCLLVVGIPATPARVAERLAWVPVRYWPSASVARGITAKPSIGPPIRLV